MDFFLLIIMCIYIDDFKGIYTKQIMLNGIRPVMDS